jgi:hypothetical protein
MKKSTKLYRQVDEIMNGMAEVEEEWIFSKSNRTRTQLMKVADRLSILQDVITGMLNS